MVLRDGIPMTEPDSFTRLDLIDGQDIERLEVTKGDNFSSLLAARNIASFIACSISAPENLSVLPAKIPRLKSS